MTRSPLVGTVGVHAAPVGPVRSANAHRAPGGAARSSREVDPSSARPASADALVTAYISAASQASSGGLGKPAAQGG